MSDFNRGDPRGELAPGSTGTPPVDPLVAVLPSEGTVISDHPLYVLDDAWVTDRQREAAQVFVEFATSEPVQESVRVAGFRSFDEAPGDLGVPVISPPAGAVLAELQVEWQTARRRLEVRLLVDLSGSMAREERLELVEQALVEVAGSAMQADDQLGLTVFTTGLGGGGAILDERVAPGRTPRTEHCSGPPPTTCGSSPTATPRSTVLFSTIVCVRRHRGPVVDLDRRGAH